MKRHEKSTGKKKFPTVATPEAAAWPLAKRLARWQSWAQNLKTRFAVRAPRQAMASRIFLQPRSLTFFNNPIHHWHVAGWQQMRSLQRLFGGARNIWRELSWWRGQFDKRPGSEQRLLVHAFGQSMSSPMITCRTPAIAQRLRSERLLRTNAAENQFITVSKALTPQPSRYSTAEMMLPAQVRERRLFLSRLSAERHFHRRELDEVKDKFNLFHRQNWETLSQHLIHSRQRAERRPGEYRTFSRVIQSRQGAERRPSPDYREGSREESMPAINFNTSIGPVLRKNTVVRQMAPANTNLPRIPEVVSPASIHPAPPIDRRLVIWRERTGRV